MSLGKKILLIVLAILVVIILLKDVLIGLVINSVGSSVVGAPVRVGSFHWGVFNQQIRIHNLRIDNPNGFPKGPLVDIPEVGVDYRLNSLLKGQMYFPFVVVNVKEVNIVRNKDGKLNVDELKVAQRGKAPAQPAPSEPQPNPKKNGDIALTIDELKLNIDRTVYSDYTKGDKPVNKVFDVGLRNKTFKNIKSVQQLVSLILIQGLAPTAIKGAAIYAAANVLGTAFLPVGVAVGAWHLLDQKLSNSNNSNTTK